jgi:hypothetical protein
MTKKETSKDGRNSEIRVRYVKPEVFKALEHIAHNFKQKTIPGTILALIDAFKPDLATDLYNAITGGFSFSQKVLLAGSANVDGLNIPVNIFYKIG